MHLTLKSHTFKLIVIGRFCQRLLELIPENAIAFFRNEAYFRSSGGINKQNKLYWSVTNKRKLLEGPLNKDEITVCYTNSAVSIIDQFLFEEEKGSSVAITSDKYADILVPFFEANLNCCDYFRNEVI